MNVCIFTTEDNFYLGKLLKKLSYSNKYNFSFIFIREHEIKITNLRKIIIRIVSIGILQSIFFFLKDLSIKIQGKSIIDSLGVGKCLIIKSIKDESILRFLKKKQSNLLLSINFPVKIPMKIINLQKYGGVNLHLGELPDFKGLYPVIRMLMSGKKYCSITTHQMTNKIDCGKILVEKKIFFENRHNIVNIYEKLFEQSEEIIYKSIESITRNIFIRKNKKEGKYFGQPSISEILKIMFYTYLKK